MHGVNLSGPVRSQLDVDRLAAWMRKHVAGFPSHAARIEVQQFVHGQSNPTFLVVADRVQFVVRKKPEGKLLAGAHQIEREYRVISALHGRGVPVPLPLGLCTDTSVIGTPFFVMSFVPGRIFKDPTLPGLQPAERFAIFSELVRVLAVLHSVDFKAAGLSGIQDFSISNHFIVSVCSFVFSDFGKHSDYCGRQKSLWSKQYSQVAAEIAKHPGHHHHVLAPSAHADAHMHSLIKYLDAAVPSVVDECCLTHGDYRLDNVIFHPTEPRIVAVLDWELATLGHPLSDLAYLCQVFHNPSAGLHTPQSREAAAAFASKHGATNTVAPYIGIADINAKRRATLGLPDEPELLRAYMRCTMRPAPISQWRTHLALSYFRAAAILHGVWARARAGNNASAIGGAVGSLYGEVAAVGMRIVEAERASPNQVCKFLISSCL
jgi:aminoglycoside phosphotransferase (APT) family kinase protein